MTMNQFSTPSQAIRALAHSVNFVLPGDRGTTTAANGKPSYSVDQAVDSILRNGYSLNGTGVIGTGAVVTYAYRATSGPMPGDTGGFSVFNAAQITATESVLEGWSDVANVTFVRIGSGSTGASAYSDDATMLFGNYASGNEGAAAFTFYPGEAGSSSSDDDIWINSSLSYEASPSLYNYGYLTLAHEIGHAIGLEDSEYLDPGYGSPSYSVNAGYYENTQQYSVMSYWSPVNTGADFGVGYASSPMMDDIAAAQKLYGANMNTRVGDTVYGFNSNSGKLLFSAASSTASLIFCVWDAGGNDTFNFSGYSQNGVIDLRATHFSSVGGMLGNVSIAQNVTIENAVGGSGDDLIIGNSANNVLNGGKGSDTVDYSFVKSTIVVSLQDGTASGLAIGLDTLVSIESVTGGTSADNLTGNNGANRLMGANGNDQLTGAGGNDYLDGGRGTDTLFGGSGNDTYVVDNITDIISEQTVPGVDDGGTDTVISYATFTLSDSFENLTLTGTANVNGTGSSVSNIISGNSASNVLQGGGGDDILFDGDTYTGAINDTGGLFHGSLASALVITPSSFALGNNPDIEDPTTVSHATILGTGDGTLRVYAINVVKGAVASFDIDHTFGLDSYLRLYDASGNLIAENDDAASIDLGGQGSTSSSDSYLKWTFAAGGTYYIEVSEYSHDAIGPGDTYQLNLSLAFNGPNVGGNDVLDGGLGADSMRGGLGNDTYYVDNVGDSVTEGANVGTDLVQSSVTFTLGTNVENLTLVGGDIDGTGNASANILRDTTGNNTLLGLVGDDTIYAGAGNDVLDGGSGLDTADFSADLAGINAVLVSGTAQGTGIGSDTLISIENLVGGAGADTFSGDDTVNVLKGGAGADTLLGLGSSDVLDGGVGSDVMRGGSGNDTYYVDNTADLVSEETVPGVDDTGIELVYSSVSFTLGNFLDNMTLIGSSKINGSGNDLNNVITGNGNANFLSGLGGNDRLNAGAGNDKLDGGAGADIMFGGAGDDTYIVNNAGDKTSEQTASGVDDGGYDLVISNLSWGLGEFLEDLILTGGGNLNGSGNDWSNSIIGNSGNNLLRGKDGWDTLRGAEGDDTLDGGSGLDSLYGGAGNDTYIVDDTGDFVSEMVGGVDGGGTDIVYASASFAINNFVETLVLTGINVIDGTGSGQANTIIGNGSSNRLFGGGGDDILDGKAGFDQLDGGEGADRMVGGVGNDTYSVDNLGDVVVENADQGIDTVKTNLKNYALGANLENLILTGETPLNGIGNGLDNVITGNKADNMLYSGKGNDTLYGGRGNDGLDGGEGADLMSGGAGNDTYSVENTLDQVAEFADEGTDEVRTNLSTYTLNDNVENLVFTGVGNATGTGNDLNNKLTGNAGNNSLFGGNGNDTLLGGDGNDWLEGGGGGDKLYGGQGDDTYVYDTGDTIIEAENAGLDTVLSYASSMKLGYTLENITLMGANAFNAIGNALDNVMIGNAIANNLQGNGGNDTLSGLDGNDILDGGSGADTLTGGLGADIFLFGLTGGADSIIDFSVSENDKIDASAYNGLAYSIMQVGLNTIIDFGGGNTITVNNTAVADLTGLIIL